jgi:hypothetical protein
VATKRLDSFRMIQKTNVTYWELHTYLKRETVEVFFFSNDLSNLLFVSAAGCHWFWKWLPLQHKFVYSECGKNSDTDSCRTFISHTGSHGMTWVSIRLCLVQNFLTKSVCVCVCARACVRAISRVLFSLLCVMQLWTVFWLSSNGVHKKQCAKVFSCGIVCKMLVAQLIAT